MTHRNSPLTPVGRLRLVQRVEDDGRPIAHVAAEAGVARSTLTKWVHRYRDDGIEALEGAEDYDLESIAGDLQRHAAHGNVESIDPTEFWVAVQKLRHRT